MLTIPNEEVLRSLVQKIEDEYDLIRLLNRYKSQSELIKLASNQGLTQIDDAIRALFVADFIVTASELPSGGTDEERYQSIIQSFIQGQSRCTSSDLLMRIYYLAYKSATAIRRQDLFQAGRGLPRKAALTRIKDSYVTPYLTISTEVLGKGFCGWELGVLAAALKRMYPNSEIKQLEGTPEYTDHKTLTDVIWRLLIAYSQVQAVDTNPNPVIPNIKESQSLLLFDAQRIGLTSLWNTTPSNFLKLKVDLPSLAKFTSQLIDNKHLVLVKGKILETTEGFFMIRSPFTASKPVLILKTTADEINFTRVLTILHLRGLEHHGWTKVLRTDEPIVEIKKIESPPETPVLDEDKDEKITEPPRKKEGFFTKIKHKFFSKKAEPEPEIEKKPVPKQLKPKLSIKVKEEKKQEQLPPFMTQSSFIAQGITVDAVSDLDLFEIFDTMREESYYIVGTFETDFNKTKTDFVTKPNSIPPSTIVTFLNALEQEISKVNANCFNNNQVLVEELFFMANDGQKMIICLDGNQERVVGTIATTFFEKIVDWQARETEAEPLQRRSLHMRTAQLLAARRHTPFREAVGRIYGANLIIEKANFSTLDQPIFSLR
ncbi:MAG: hypothetical protein JSW11_02905 [Candidatus Heimdallarchaeota archaeon]|nr:MAG: hypothetical protein JSW11_02905 [Candidatus Heimdallarchaeota archaeon]